jgi:hypothetical protein
MNKKGREGRRKEERKRGREGRREGRGNSNTET